MLGALEVLPFETPADLIYGRVRSGLERKGQLIGGNDMLIAAQVIARDQTLITDNADEFERVDGLSHSNWLRDG